MTVEVEYRGDDQSAGAVLSLIASGKVKSRAEIVEVLKWSRTTVTQRLGFLLATGLVDEGAEAIAGRGRPTRTLRLNTNIGVVLAADIGEKSIRIAVTDLSPTVLIETRVSQDVGGGPTTVLKAVADGFEALLSEVGRSVDDVLGIGLSLPAPIDFGAGRVVGPSVMRGWDNFDIREWMLTRFAAPVSVENDVNLLTLCESRRFWNSIGQFLYVKAGTGIGSGIISNGVLQRGAEGAAGDIGHIQINGPSGPLCRCGKLGCLEAYASGWAVSRDLRAQGLDAHEARDVLKYIRAGDPIALNLVGAAGRKFGEVVASAVSILNPRVIVIGGTLSGAGDRLLAGIREIVYQRSLPLATRDLQIVQGQSGDNAGILGAALLVIETEMQAGSIERLVARHRQRALAR